MTIDYSVVRSRAQAYLPPMCGFLRDLVKIPSESGHEAAIIERVRREMASVGFDRIEIDPMGNILGYVGTGPHLIAMDAHVDTVRPGCIDNWSHDPYAGHDTDTAIYGLGAGDQAGGMAAMVYAVKIMKEMGLWKMDRLADVTLLVTGTVMEEVCDGLCWRYLIEQSNIRPEFVVCTEPSSGSIRRGQKGRMEMQVHVMGKSAHGSVPHKGDNAIFKMARILGEIEQLSARLRDDPFLGKGTVTVSEIFSTAPSRCSVADTCWISLDRRLTAGETIEGAVKEIEQLPAVRAARAEVTIYGYDDPAYTGLVYPAECAFPSWTIEEGDPACRALATAYTRLFHTAPKIESWAFSTNGVAIMGRHGIPCIGFGPGRVDQAHVPDEHIHKQDLAAAAAMYAVIPGIYAEQIDSAEPLSKDKQRTSHD